MTGRTLWAALSYTYACLYILEIWSVKLYDYPELILIFYRLVTFKKPTKYLFITVVFAEVKNKTQRNSEWKPTSVGIWYRLVK